MSRGPGLLEGKSGSAIIWSYVPSFREERRMKKRKKIFSVILMICMMFIFCSCGKEDVGEADVMKKVIENMQAVKSATAENVMDMVMSMGKETMSMTTEMRYTVISEPMAAEVIANVGMTMSGKKQNTQSKIYAEADGDNLVTYTKVGEQWLKTIQTGDEALKEYDIIASTVAYLEVVQDVKKAATEEVSGVKADKYEGVIKEDYLQTVLVESGLGEQLGIDGQDSAAMKKIFEGIGDMPIAIWIDSEKLLPVKYDFDMSAMMTVMMNNMGAAGQGLSIDKFAMSMTFTGYDNVDNIRIPQEARDAEEL